MANHQVGNAAGVTAARGSANEVQTIRGGATAGSFQLQFADENTSALTFDDIAADVQTAIRALSNVSATGVVCAGGPLNVAPITVTFQNEYAGADVERLKVVNINLTGGTVTVEDTTEPTPFFDVDMLSIAAMRSRLATIDAGTYTSAYLDTLTENDMRYALRVHDAPLSIQ